MSVYPSEMVPDIDLGDDHYLVFSRWAPDDLPANRQWLNLGPDDPMPVVEKYAAIIRHYRPDGTLCEGCITFDGEWARKHRPHEHLWKVESWEPLTVSPSLLCKAPVLGPDEKPTGAVCGDHGFIRNGKWVRA